MIAADPLTWFQERVRPLVGEFADGLDDAHWVGLGETVSDETLARVEELLLRRDGAPVRTVLTSMAGWATGYVAAVMAVGVLRDGVLVRLSRADGLEVLQHASGWLADLRLARAPVAVGRDHPWAGVGGIEVVDSIDEAFAAEVVRVGEPLMSALSERSGRGVTGLWAQVPDRLAVVPTSVSEAEPGLALAEALEGLERLLDAPGAPWNTRPRFSIDELDGRPYLVTHRGGCCLWYRCDPAAADGEPYAPDPEWLAQFGDEGLDYCESCLFRTAEDVRARAAFWAERT